ncbi:WbqC family protein [Pseudomonadota bacterium]
MRIVSGHQPVYLPWLGLFHKIALCDVFVFMDDVQYLKQDWNNRNRIKGSQGAFGLTVPVQLKKSASLMLKDIVIADDPWENKNHWQRAHWKSIQSSYAGAPYWGDYAEQLEAIYLEKPWTHLADLNEKMLKLFLKCLGLQVEMVKGSEMGFVGKKSELVLDHCQKLNGNFCVLGTHGRDYLDEASFTQRNIGFYYQDYHHPVYPQKFGKFESHLSIIDLLFNCGPTSREVLMSGNICKADLKHLGGPSGDAQ